MYVPVSDGKGIAQVVVVEWDDLVLSSRDHQSHSERINRIQSAIERAYGLQTGIGILAVRGVPGFVQAKDAFLPMAHTLATQLPESYREEHLTDPASLYNAGWSFGKEKLGHDKPPDTAKGSFYYNPVTDVPGTEEDRIKYPYSYPCNKWPDQTLLPHFQENANAIGLILRDVCLEVAKHLDTFVQVRLSSLHSDAKIVSLYHNLKNTDKVKARLLYYFPLSEKAGETADVSSDVKLSNRNETVEDSWIGWHNDSGFLTALAGDIYVSHKTGARITDGVDPNAGLYVMDRTSAEKTILHVPIPHDCCAVQLGECTQIVTGGTLVATPHCVRGCNSILYPDVARISLPCFVDTYPAFPLSIPNGISRQQVLAADAYSHDRVPPLALRWKTGIADDVNEPISTDPPPMTFGEFLQATFQMYYTWEPSRSQSSDTNACEP